MFHTCTDFDRNIITDNLYSLIKFTTRIAFFLKQFILYISDMWKAKFRFEYTKTAYNLQAKSPQRDVFILIFKISNNAERF